MEKLPPIEKIYEAYSAIADHRVSISTNYANVLYSDKSKSYYVQWDGNTYKSNDSATYWQGYPGYPILAVLMLQEKLPLNQAVANHFKGVNWTGLNKKYKANYTDAVTSVLHHLDKEGVPIDFIQSEIKTVFRKIKTLKIQVKRGGRKTRQ